MSCPNCETVEESEKINTLESWDFAETTRISHLRGEETTEATLSAENLRIVIKKLNEVIEYLNQKEK